tara:strand:+ start:329 stop:805 length:477 start_codon:yes stop_codon:yes gene_type:complete
MIQEIYKIKSDLFKRLFRKKKRRSPKRKNNQVRKTNDSKRVAISSTRNLRGRNYDIYNVKKDIYPSIIIFFGFIILSLTIFLFAKQIQPFLKNQRLKILCTYQLGDKKNQSYRDAKLELEKLVGDSYKYCNNFLLPKEKNRKRFRFFPIMKNILFRFF